MNSTTYGQLTPEDLAAFGDTVRIREDIPDGVVVYDGQPLPVSEAVMAAKRDAETRAYGHRTRRSGITKNGAQPRDKAKAKAARAARKRNRKG